VSQANRRRNIHSSTGKKERLVICLGKPDTVKNVVIMECCGAFLDQRSSPFGLSSYDNISGELTASGNTGGLSHAGPPTGLPIGPPTVGPGPPTLQGHGPPTAGPPTVHGHGPPTLHGHGSLTAGPPTGLPIRPPTAGPPTLHDAGPPTLLGYGPPTTGPPTGLPIGPPTLHGHGRSSAAWKPVPVTQPSSSVMVSRGQESTPLDVSRLTANMQVMIIELHSI